MKKDITIYLSHILESINFIDEYLKNCDKKDFLNSWEKKDAVTRRLEIIGEAVKNIPQKIRNNYYKIPWKKISNTRNKLIHEYFGVDYDLTWSIISKELPKLKQQIEQILEELK